MKKFILLTLLAITTSSLKATDYDELRDLVRQQNSELEDAERNVRRARRDAEFNGDDDAAYQLRKTERKLRDAQVILY